MRKVYANNASLKFVGRVCAGPRYPHNDDGDGDGDGVAQDGGHTPPNRLTETCNLGL